MNPELKNTPNIPSEPAAGLPSDSVNSLGKPTVGPSYIGDKHPSSSDYSNPRPSKLGKDGWRSAVSTLLLFLLAPIIALTIAAFVVQSYQVDGESMEATLQHQDRLIVSKLSRTWARFTNNSYIPNRGDIIIFNQPDSPDTTFTQDKQLIKRVIALPGERIVIKDGKITVYNDERPAGFNPDSSSGYSIKARFTSDSVDLIVPKNEVFVCGDNRQNSEDSRWFGPVPAEKIVGKLVLRLLPLDKLQTF